MRVKAVFKNKQKFGFYGSLRRRDGDVFRLEKPEHLSKSWMVRVDEEPSKGKHVKNRSK